MKSATTSAPVFHLDTMILLLQQRSNITNIVDYAMHGSRHNAVMRVYDTACTVMEAPAQGQIQRVVAWLTSYRTVDCHCHVCL
jgi:hypothetical protein